MCIYLIKDNEFKGEVIIFNKLFKNAERAGFGFVEAILAIVIIGFVASFTIKTIKQSVFDAEQKSLFKKSVSTMSNVLLKVKADLGYQPECYYLDQSWVQKFNDCSTFFTSMANNLNVSKYCANNAFSNGCIPTMKGADTVVQGNNPGFSIADAQAQVSGLDGFWENYLKTSTPAYILLDGTIIMIYKNSFPFFLVDINGKKPPNKWGYDIYIFMLRGNSDYAKFVCYDSVLEAGGTACSAVMK